MKIAEGKRAAGDEIRGVDELSGPFIRSPRTQHNRNTTTPYRPSRLSSGSRSTRENHPKSGKTAIAGSSPPCTPASDNDVLLLNAQYSCTDDDVATASVCILLGVARPLFTARSTLPTTPEGYDPAKRLYCMLYDKDVFKQTCMLCKNDKGNIIGDDCYCCTTTVTLVLGDKGVRLGDFFFFVSKKRKSSGRFP